MQVKSKNYIIDYSSFPQEKARAEEISKYLESKHTEIYALLGVQLPKGLKTTIKFKRRPADQGPAQKVDEYIIEYDPEQIKKNNKGVLVHEVAHVAQNFECEGDWKWVVEAIADEVRLKLGWDNPAENPIFTECMIQKDKRINQQNSGCRYRVWRDFFEWIAKRYQGDLLKDFTKALKDGLNDDNFLDEKFSKTADDLWQEYLEQF